jgi:hypothetical protein
MSDLPLHEGVVGVMRHYGDTDFFPTGLYELNLGHPNQLFYVLAVALSFVVGTTWAVKLVVAATQVGMLVAGARLSDHLGRSRCGALLFAPLALGFTYYWGLVTNLVGFVVFFGALPLLDEASVKPGLRELAKAFGAMLLLYLAHESVLLIAVGFQAVLVVARPFDRRLTPLRMLPIVGSAAFAIGHFLWSRRFLTGGQLVPPPWFPSLWSKILHLPDDVFGSHDPIAAGLLVLLGVVAMVSLAVARVRSRELLPDRPEGQGRLARLQSLLLHYRFEALAVAFLVAAALAPDTYQGATLLHARFLGPAWALFGVTAAPREEPSRLARLATVCLPLGMALLSWPQFVDSHQAYRHLDELIEQIPRNSAVALAAVDKPLYRTRVYSAGTGPARTVALRGGRNMIGLYHSPLSPVQLRREHRWDELDVRTLLSGSMALMPRTDLTRLGWVIAESRDPNVRNLLVTAFAPDAELVASSGEWLLFRSTHAQRPLTSPDLPERPIGDTIYDRVSYLVRRQRNPPPPGAVVPIPWQIPDPPPP